MCQTITNKICKSFRRKKILRLVLTTIFFSGVVLQFYQWIRLNKLLLGSTDKFEQNIIVDESTLKRFFELPGSIFKKLTGKRIKNNYAAYTKATVIRNETTWFKPRQLCKATCCVRTVAISMEQDKHKIINTVDGNDVADLVLQQYNRRRNHLKFHANFLREEMIPCILPGTIIEIHNYLNIIKYFRSVIRPKMVHPYVLITQQSDINTPLDRKLLSDPLLMKLHGTNPAVIRKNFRPINLGLSSQHPQEKFIFPYLQINKFINPFTNNKDRWDFSKHPFDFDKDVFIHFSRRRKWRDRLWILLCNSKNKTVAEINGDIDMISCNNNTSNLPNIDIYTGMSKYRFGLSPTGAGYDCYRTYELLLLGVIPIIESRDSISQQLFEGLPVVHMKNLKNVKSRQDIEDAIKEYIESNPFQNITFETGWEKLFLDYRRRITLKDADREKDILLDEDGKEYYQAFHYSVVGGDNNKSPLFCSKEGNCKGLEEQRSYTMPILSDEEITWLQKWNESGKATT